jgi:hypothetical protein
LIQSNGTFSFGWPTVSNLNYQVQCSTDLTSTNWVICLRGEWWKAPLTLPDWLELPLAVWRQLIIAVETLLEALTQQVEALAPKERPKGVGPLTLDF